MASEMLEDARVWIFMTKESTDNTETKTGDNVVSVNFEVEKFSKETLEIVAQTGMWRYCTTTNEKQQVKF